MNAHPTHVDRMLTLIRRWFGDVELHQAKGSGGDGVFHRESCGQFDVSMREANVEVCHECFCKVGLRQLPKCALAVARLVETGRLKRAGA